MKEKLLQSGEDEEYHLTEDDLIWFKMKEFHVKPYSSHPRYQKTLIAIKKSYYWSNLKKEVVNFVANQIEW